MCIRDSYRTYVTEVKTQHDKPGDLKLKLANKPSDLADMLTDIANKAPVSYTHLDVYKRQHHDRSKRKLQPDRGAG